MIRLMPPLVGFVLAALSPGHCPQAAATNPAVTNPAVTNAAVTNAAVANAAVANPAVTSPAATSPAAAVPAASEAPPVDVAPDDASDADARRALGRWWRFPWYNRQTDDVEPVLVRPKKPASIPDLSLLQIIAWVVVAVVLAVLVWLIVTAIINYAGFKQPEVVGPRIATHVDHVEALPFLRQRSLDDLLGQARAHYLAGDYNEAIVYLFSYELVELDRHNLIRLAVGRTNRQYLRDLKGRARSWGWSRAR